MAIDMGEISNRIITEAYGRLSSDRKYRKITRREAVNQISRYAMTDTREALAEALSDWHANKENASPLSVEIIRVLKESLE